MESVRLKRISERLIECLRRAHGRVRHVRVALPVRAPEPTCLSGSLQRVHKCEFLVWWVVVTWE